MFVHVHLNAQWGKGVPVEIVLSFQDGPGAHVWSDVREAQQVQLHVDLREQLVPYLEWKAGWEATEDANCMGFPCLNCFFGYVASVLAFWD